MTMASRRQFPTGLSKRCIEQVLEGDLDALDVAFAWVESREGFEYWRNIRHGCTPFDETAKRKLGRLLALCPGEAADTPPNPGLPSEAAVAKLMGCGVAWRDAGRVIEALREAYAIDFPAALREAYAIDFLAEAREK